MKNFLENGGSILAMSGEGGENNMKTNVNYFLEEYGISVNTGNNKFLYSIYVVSLCISLKFSVIYFIIIKWRPGTFACYHLIFYSHLFIHVSDS